MKQIIHPVKTVCLVGCSKTKLTVPAQAQDLYTSPLFKLGRAWAETHADHWGILSAKFGALSPEQVIEPYDQVLLDHRPMGEARLSPPDFRGWFSARVQCWLAQFCTFNHRPEVIVLAGQNYCELLEQGFMKLTLVKPMAGLEIGNRLAWLKGQLETNQGAA